jgi:hypothetical protein
MFVRVSLDDGSKHEWGWNAEVVPIIGDTVILSCEIPDQKDTGNRHLEVRVNKREFWPAEDHIYLTVECEESVPRGYIAHSPAWPSDEYSQRRRELERDLARIRGE